MNQGENLIFLISLPRSGSTLLQHILAGHSKIGATAEPWIMFPASLALKENSYTAPYGAHISRIGLTDFLNQLKEGNEVYYESVRKMGLHMYESFLKEKNKTFFLDKTSRYYLIIEELNKIFPAAKFIFLFRNPLALFGSFLQTMITDKNYMNLGDDGVRNDLLEGYHAMTRASDYMDAGRVIKVNYESIVSGPEKEVQILCARLGIGFEEKMISYKESVGVLSGKLVDPKSIHKHNKPVTDYIDSWKETISTLQDKYLAWSFLKHLGETVVEKSGYSYPLLFEKLGIQQSKKFGSPFLIKWNDLMCLPADRTFIMRNRLSVCSLWQKWVSGN